MSAQEAKSNSQGLSADFWEKATGREKYFKPESNKDHDLVLANWRAIEMRGNVGLEFDVLSVDGKEYPPATKFWTVTSKRALREFEPIIRAAETEGMMSLRVLFRKSLARGEESTAAKFTIRNLVPELDKHLDKEQRSEETIKG